MGGGRTLPLTQNYHEAPILENFVADAPMKKKIKKFSSTPLSEQFEIWIWKPAIAKRVNVPGALGQGAVEGADGGRDAEDGSKHNYSTGDHSKWREN